MLGSKKYLVAFCFLHTAALLAQPLAPVQIKYECSADDKDALGLSCSDDQPCPVFLELSSASSNGSRVFVTGNLHTRDTTLYGVLLSSADNGVTWTEPTPRLRAAAFEQVEFFDPLHGWVSGESVDPLTRNPFVLLSTDGGNTWMQKLMFEDSKFGAVAQFHFTSATSGELLLDTSQGRSIHQELYASETGGESWEMKQRSTARIRLDNTSSAPPQTWRLRADAPSGAVRLEHNESGKTWQPVADFTIHVSDCK